MSVLIAFATAHNTTKDIGQRIAARLATHIQCPIKVVNMADVPRGGVAPYSAVILGSAIHMQSWLSPARKFMHAERATLAQRPVWAYSVGVPDTRQHEAQEEEKVAKDVRKEIPELRGHALFKGRVEKEHLGWPGKLLFKFFPNLWKFGDFVEWEKVDAWADEVGIELKGVVNEGVSV